MRERQAVAALAELAPAAHDAMGLLLALADACENERDESICLTVAARLGEALNRAMSLPVA